jgi:predicted XRE-type DNA-binding protein
VKKTRAVFHDLGFTEAESLALTFKADIYSKILDVVKTKKISPRELEKILAVPQPRVSELLNGRLSSTSIEKLLTYLENLGVAASISFKSQRAG